MSQDKKIRVFKIEDCYRLDVKKMLRELNSSKKVQPSNLDKEFEEYLSVANLEVFP